MSNETAILADAKLDSGMTAREAVDRARAWWDGRGRKLLDGMPRKDPVMAAHSGVIGGHAFDRLTQREQVAIVKVWHHFFIRRPDVLQVEADAKFKLGGDEVVQ